MKPSKKAEKRAEMPEGSAPILENRNVKNDYSTLLPLLKPGLKVLDVGCGTGTLSADIANYVSPQGSVVGIDNSEQLIGRGRLLYKQLPNLYLEEADLFSYKPDHPFDLIVSARVLQWLSNPYQAVNLLISWLRSGGILSVLDYDHTAIQFSPSPPDSMLYFYEQFLKWRRDAGMNNAIAKDLPAYFERAGLNQIESINANQSYHKGEDDFAFKAGIWADVAASRGNQMVQDGYLIEDARIMAIDEYRHWVSHEAIKMTMILREVRGIKA